MNNKIVANYHNHCYLCRHAYGLISDYVERAIKLGYEEIGFSDHAPIDKSKVDVGKTRRMTFEEIYSRYLPEIDESINKYGSQIKILKGFEIEYFPELKSDYELFLKDVQYLILGQHYFWSKNKIASIYSFEATTEVLNDYVTSVVEALNSGYFKIIAHPELFLWSYKKWDDTAEEASKRIIEAAIKNNVYIEINTNGISICSKRDKKVVLEKTNYELMDNYSFAYPNGYFFKLASTYKDAKFVINQDCHEVEHLGDDTLNIALKMCEELGIKIEQKIDIN